MANPVIPSPTVERLIIAYDVLLILGLFVVGGVISTALFAQNIKRSATWFSFMISTLLYSLSYLIIIGEQSALEGQRPGRGSCLVQAGLVHTTPIMTSMTALAMMIHICMTVSGSLTKASFPEYFGSTLLVLVPHLFSFVVFLMAIIIGLRFPYKIDLSYSGMFCMLWDDVPNKFFATLTIVSVAAMVVFEALTAMHLRRHWRALRDTEYAGTMFQSLSMVIRLTLFTFLPMIALAVSIVFSFAPPGKWSQEKVAGINLCSALFPLMVGLIFGSQDDILHVWMFWRVYAVPVTRSHTSQSSQSTTSTFTEKVALLS